MDDFDRFLILEGVLVGFLYLDFHKFFKVGSYGIFALVFNIREKAHVELVKIAR